MQQAITEILFMVREGQDLEVALHTVLSKYTLTRNEFSLMALDQSWKFDLENYMKRKALDGTSIKSMKNYKFVIGSMLNSINKPIPDITTEDIQLYLAYMKNIKGSSDKYLKGIRTVLNGFFTWAVKNKRIEWNPIDGVAQVKVRERHVPAYTEEEVERMRRACADGRNSIRDRAILELLYSSGIRCDELIQLDISDINLATMEGIVRHGKGDKERIFYFSHVAAMYLKEYLTTRGDTYGPLFVSYRTKERIKGDSTIEHLVKTWGDKGGVQGATPHRFRHTFITRCIDKGISVEDTRVLAGHENIDTTMRYYDDNKTRVKAEHKRLCA